MRQSAKYAAVAYSHFSDMPRLWNKQTNQWQNRCNIPRHIQLWRASTRVSLTRDSVPTPEMLLTARQPLNRCRLPSLPVGLARTAHLHRQPSTEKVLVFSNFFHEKKTNIQIYYTSKQKFPCNDNILLGTYRSNYNINNCNVRLYYNKSGMVRFLGDGIAQPLFSTFKLIAKLESTCRPNWPNATLK